MTDADTGFDVPVAVIGFNRPLLLRRTLDAVALIQPKRLFLIADGPRPGYPEDANLCRLTRLEMDHISWPADVSRRYTEVNRGCEATVELGLDWVFQQVDRAIVLEDDCVPGSDFFGFAAELLSRYADDERIWQISGNRHGVPPGLFQADYAFAAWASVWGWATWADRWQRHRRLFPRDHCAPDGDRPARSRPFRADVETLVTKGARRHFAEAAVSGDVVSHGWDKHWWISVLDHGGLAVAPARNLVSNQGFGPDATHSVSKRRAVEPLEAMALPLRHPSVVELDREVERELELVLARIGGPVARAARHIVRSVLLRRWARRLVSTRAVTTARRRWSRVCAR